MATSIIPQAHSSPIFNAGSEYKEGTFSNQKIAHWREWIAQNNDITSYVLIYC